MYKKIILKDAGTHKCAIGNFRSFQIGCLGADLLMTKDRDVSSQIHGYHMLISDLGNEDIKLPKPFVAGYSIETLLKSWKDDKNNMKQKRKLKSLEYMIIHIRIEEQSWNKDKAKKVKEMSSKANVVEEKPKPKNNRSRK